MDDVKLSDAKIFLIKLQRDGRGYSSIHSIRGVLRPAFQMAVDDDLILKNPFGFELGTILVNDSQKREAVSLEDETRFLEFVKNDPHYNRYYDAFYILFKTRLRISEFCGLTVRDLDFKNEVIRIDHQLQRTRDMKYEIVSTKTTSGTRLLPMEEDVKDAFLRILKNRKKTKKELARLKEAKKELDKNRLCAQLRVCSQAGGIPVYPRFSQPDNSESWDDAGNGI